MMNISRLIVVFATCFVTSCSTDDGELDWWQNAVIYQIYPRSFMDSNNDGTGDLKGIISKLDHLKEAGITATWLSPIFDSPQVDTGYDIRNYYAIDKLFGTMEDFEALIARAKELGIKIILDFVPNHTSDEHDWFRLSVNKSAGYEDFYVWKDGNPEIPPNNWLSSFKGSAWKWHKTRQQYYYHQFSEHQPDLNYSNPNVLKEMQKVLYFWLEKGVGGFRMDAVPYLFEDPSFRDAPLAQGYTKCEEDSKCQVQINYVKDLDSTFDTIYQFREFIDQYTKDNNINETIVLITEAYTTVENTMLYYGSSDGKRKGAHFTFNFNFITYLQKKIFTVDDIFNAINKWLVFVPRGVTSNWVLGNHDNHRMATRFGEENVDGFNMLLGVLPGVMVTYNGEEIGMLDGEVACHERRDIGAVKDCKTFNETSRDFERTPFQWDNSTYAGFSIVKPWLPAAANKDRLNLEAQRSGKSHFNVYKQITQFRTVFNRRTSLDNFSFMKINENVVQIVRTRDYGEFIFLFNIGDTEETVNFYRRSRCYQVLVASANSDQNKGDRVESVLILKGHESLILQNQDSSSLTASKFISFSLTLEYLCIYILSIF